MEIVYHITEKFEKDLQNYESLKIMASIEKHSLGFIKNKKNYVEKFYQPYIIKLLNDCKSTLYILKLLPNKVGVIVTIDNDILFGRIIVTLYRILPIKEVETEYKTIAKILYEEIPV